MKDSERYQSLAPALLPWFRANARDLPWRRDKEPYHVWLSEIMLQQTRVEAVKGYYERFLESLPTIQALASAPEEQLLKLWEGLGYYNRVRNLQKAAVQICDKHGGVFPREFEAVSALPGIGDYTAGAIASICFEQPTPAVDGNVLRVLSRVVESRAVIDELKTKQLFSNELKKVYPAGSSGDFTQSLMELGATVCVPNGAPLCRQCPLSVFCLSSKHGTWDSIPVRKEKRPRKKEEKTVFLFWHNDCLAVRKRDEKGVLNGMWEFPNVCGQLNREEAAAQAGKWLLEPQNLIKSLKRKHIFTHIEWDMTAYVFECGASSSLFIWANQKELEETVALPSAFKQFLL